MRKLLLFILPLLFCTFISNAQFSDSDATVAMQLLNTHKARIGLTADDLNNVKITNTYTDNSWGITYVYLIQTHQGIPVFNQMLVLAFKNDKLVSNAGLFNRSVPKLANVATGIPSVSAESAVQFALADRKMPAAPMVIAINRKDDGHKIEFGNLGVSRENIIAQLMWVPIEDAVNNVNVVTKMRLAWQVTVVPKTTADYWWVRVDATDNHIIGTTNLTDYDNWGTPSTENKSVENPSFINGMQQTAFAGNNLFDFKEITKLSEQMPDGPTVVNSALYRVIPFPAEAPSFPNGAPATRTDPWTAAAGVPNAVTLKWHTGASATDYAYTRGNNVWAYEDRTPPLNSGSVAKSASSTTALPNLTFDFVPNFTVTPTQTTPVQNQQFNITNLFYWNNVMHDVMYIYGFTEAAANFQDDNMGRGGLGNDHVNAEAQDIGGTNNANFGTPPDGGSGTMQMYLWTTANPNLDGDVDNGIICHEFGHGISNRFTGGGSSGCLGNAEQMGEGWGDYNALMFTQNWATSTLNTGFNSPRGVGTYALNQPPTGLGIRSQRYCTDFTVNNKVYLAVLPGVGQQHARGEIWCATLWDMTWNIINQVGTINPNLYDLAGGGGNTIAFKLVNEGMRLQQCNPGFISGRNAILAADQALYGGLYNCAIWEAFRRRGMGAFASEGSTNSTTDQVPDFTPPITLTATVSAATIPEGQNLTYTNTVFTCSAVSGYTLRDTLPTNVTYVSGGTYDAVNRVVSFAVNQGAGTTSYSFIVNVNPGSYFPPVTLINEPIAGASIPGTWTTTAPLGNPWTVSTTISNSAPNSFYVQNLPADGDQRLGTTSTYALPVNSYPQLSFWHRFNTEDGWDGGVVEDSTSASTVWNDLGANMVLGGYNGGLGVSPANPLGGRSAFTGIQSTFMNTKVSLAPWVGQSVKLRFRFGSDNNTTAPTSPAGWWVDDIVLNYVAAVNMRSGLFNASNTRVLFKDMVTEITQFVVCAPVINTHPTNVTICNASSTSFTCVGAATGGVTYQWQLSTTGAGGPWNDLANGPPYSGVTLSTLTINPTALSMNGYMYRCVVTGGCPPNATSNAATLTVIAASIGGTVTPANNSVCGTTNSGTLTLSGHTGAVVRWESSTVSAGGPFTPIANTTTTLTFTNITQTTWYRAVVQVPGCVEAPSSVATVTFIASNAMIIVAVPGTTLCQGDPAALTVMESGAVLPVIVTHSSSNAITALTGVSCGSAASTTVNSYWRVYDLSAFPAVTGSFTINSVNFGIEQLSGGTQLFTVRLYTQTGAPFPGGIHTPLASQTFNIPVQALTIYTATFAVPVTVPNNSIIVVEVEKSQQVAGQFFFPGGNAAAETGPSYLSAAACGIVTPVTYASIGFPNTHLVMALAGTVPGVGGIVTGGTFLWSPAAGLSSTTTNPVAASPATTTTYTVLHNNGSGCIRQANITLNVNLRPAITSHPANAIICSGSIATFTVTAVGAGVTYQWQESVAAGPFLNIINGGAYSGATTPTLTINPVTLAMNNNRYRCVLTGICPPAGTANISNAALLTINALPVVTVTPTSGCGGVAGISGLLLSTGSLAPPVPGTLTVSSGTIAVNIPDGPATWPQTSFPGVTTNLAVTGIPANATITGMSVKLNLTHTYIADMVIVLKAPNGAVLNLDANINKTGGPGANFVNTFINSTSAAPLSSGTPPYSGQYMPDAVGATYVAVGFTFPGGPTSPAGYIPTVSAFSGLYSTPNGTWSLGMYDWGAGDLGTLTNWELKIDYTTPGGTGTPLTYTWSPAAGLYMDPIATIPYIAGTQTPQVYASPTVYTAYTVTGTDGTTGCSSTATALVNYTPPAPTVVPSSVTMCLGDPAVKLKSSSSQTFTASFTSGAVNTTIPDGPTIPPVPTSYPAIVSNITASGIPAVGTIANVRVRLNVTHDYVSDLVIALKAPNGQIINLSALANYANPAGANFVNTTFSSASTTAITPPYTGTYKADLAGATFTALGFTWPGGPTGYVPTSNVWSSLYSIPNGVWSIGLYDAGAPDGGVLNDWTLEIDYVVGVPATPAVWSPISGLFSDALATTAYVAGTAVDSVWARPTPSGVYPYTATVQSLGLTPSTVSTNFASGNGNFVITFNFRNNNSFPVNITGIDGLAFAAGASNVEVWYNATNINGSPGAITNANGWFQFGTAAITAIGGTTVQPFVSGLSFPIPANTTYRILVSCATAANAFNMGYSTIAPGTYTFSGGGCDIVTGTNIGYGGVAIPGTPTFNDRGFIGAVRFGQTITPCTSPARTVVVTVNQPTTVIVQPANQTICTDKVATFTAAGGGTGPFTYQWQESINSGNNWTNIINGGVYSGATTAILVITAPPVSMNGYFYRVVINGGAPCAADTSAQRLLTVNPVPNIVITANPYTRLLPGLITTLSSVVTPNAAGAGGYTWLRDGVAVPGAGTGTLNVGVDALGTYSLRVTDVNGCTNTSNSVTITDSVSGKCFIYPNPNSGIFQVRYYSALNNVLPRILTVYDAKGELVLTKTYIIGRPYDRMDVDLRKNGKGLYWVEIGDMNGKRLTMCRVVIQ